MCLRYQKVSGEMMVPSSVAGRIYLFFVHEGTHGVNEMHYEIFNNIYEKKGRHRYHHVVKRNVKFYEPNMQLNCKSMKVKSSVHH